MARTQKSNDNDDATGLTARLETDGQGVRRIVLESEADSRLPGQLIDALEPYIGFSRRTAETWPTIPNAAHEPGAP
jgi:hypothetical protein